MEADHWAGGLIGLALVIYLFWVLFNPEDL
jgi:K+-transporting ATPase KdpF subunit